MSRIQEEMHDFAEKRDSFWSTFPWLSTLCTVAHLLDSTVHTDGLFVHVGQRRKPHTDVSRSLLGPPLSMVAGFQEDNVNAQGLIESPLTSGGLVFHSSKLVTWPSQRQGGTGTT